MKKIKFTSRLTCTILIIGFSSACKKENSQESTKRYVTNL